MQRTHNRSEASRIDSERHLHPYTNPRKLEADGPVVICGGDGIWVVDEDGNRYMEGLAGLWCASLGFSERRLADAAYRQMLELPFYHSFAGRVPEVTARLAAKLMDWSPLPFARVLFANSGSESNDAAFKLVHYYNNAKGRPQKKKIIARDRSYHGSTAVASAMSGLSAARKMFELDIPGIVRVSCPHYYAYGLPGETIGQFSDRLVEEFEQTILREAPETVAAFIAEPVIGGGGVVIPPPGYYEGIQAILRKYDILFIADEVISGFGRLGEAFGSTVFGLKPDMITVAKMLSAAYAPISALYLSEDIYETIKQGSDTVGVFGHGFTYSGHPVAAAVALETLRIYEDDGILDHVRRVAPRFQDGLKALAYHPLVGDVRGMGLIGAIELAEQPALRKPFAPEKGVGAYFLGRALANGLILRAVPGDIITFAPPLIIKEAEIDDLMDRVRLSLDETLAWLRPQA